jgi:hypothetical protein
MTGGKDERSQKNSYSHAFQLLSPRISLEDLVLKVIQIVKGNIHDQLFCKYRQ